MRSANHAENGMPAVSPPATESKASSNTTSLNVPSPDELIVPITSNVAFGVKVFIQTRGVVEADIVNIDVSPASENTNPFVPTSATPSGLNLTNFSLSVSCPMV